MDEDFGDTEDKTLRDHLGEPSTWIRLVYMLIFAVAFYVTRIVIGVVAFFQFLALLFTGESNARLRGFGGTLSTYVQAVVAFLTFNSEERPFPFAPWPVAEGPDAASTRPPARRTGPRRRAPSADAGDVDDDTQ